MYIIDIMRVSRISCLRTLRQWIDRIGVNYIYIINSIN